MKNELKCYVFKGVKTDYFVSPKGEVYSNKKNTMYKMRQTKTARGYVKVRLCINGKIYNRNVHRIVAETFIPNPDNKPEVNHIDGNKKNNNVTNLEWVTRRENAIHAYKNELFGSIDSFPTADITKEQCIEVCELLQNTDLPLIKIAIETNVSIHVVYSILHLCTWKHISKDYDFSKREFLTRIDEQTAKKICELLELGYTAKDISIKLNCKIHVIKDIKRRKTWKTLSKNYKF